MKKHRKIATVMLAHDLDISLEVCVCVIAVTWGFTSSFHFAVFTLCSSFTAGFYN